MVHHHLKLLSESVVVGIIALIIGLIILYLSVDFAGSNDIHSLYIITCISLFITGFISYLSAYWVAYKKVGHHTE